MTIVLVILGLALIGLATALVAVTRRPRVDEASLVERLVATNTAVMQTHHERAAVELGSATSVIGERVAALNGELARVTDFVKEQERSRATQYGQLESRLQLTGEGISTLTETVQSLREVLSSTKARGRWGERMAEDVLRLSGLIENVNYRKQRGIEGGVPDFTFLLPNDLVLHMDVKFPLDNYVRCVEAASEFDEKRYRDDFLRDVRGHVKALASRTYIDPAGGTVDFVLLFIPNDALHTFIHEHDGSILDAAAERHVVFCSPLTLFAVLALIRQTIDNVALAKTSDEILGVLAAFKKQWAAFVDKMDKLDRSITTVRKDYDELAGTRRRALERPLERIEALRQEQELVLVDGEEAPVALEA